MTDIQRMQTLYELYGSYRQVAREMHVSRNTVKKYLHRIDDVREGSHTEILPVNRETSQPRRVVTDLIISLVHSLLEANQKKPKKQRLTAKMIHDRVIQSGHQVSYPTIKRLIHEWNNEYKHREVFILQDPELGRAEFDWGEIQLQIENTWTKIYFAVMVLTGSLFRFAQLFYRETQQDVIETHIQLFEEINAVPNRIFYDNLRAVYDSKRKEFNETFLRFATHYGFNPQVCNPSSPHEKGTDEQSVGYIRRNVFGERIAFDSLQEAQNWLKEKLTLLNSKSVHRRDLIPIEGLKAERKQMRVLPSLQYSNYLTSNSRISKYSLLKFETNYYSVPDDYPSNKITLKVFVDRIDLVDGNNVIASHSRLYGSGQYSLDITHYLKTMERKPGSVKQSKAFAQLHEKLQLMYHKYYGARPEEFIKVLFLIKETSLGGLLYAIDYLNDNGIAPEYDIIRMIVHQKSFQLIEPFIFEDQIRVNEPDLSVYDDLIGG
jgi:transposase